ncbi:TetR/AcrR family transcriptional regulator [Litoribrevibacter albus]|uniref:TetR family transcriptional regulator n=1 Tax=Litoribrevibacter albus TaxID=1473156 RepID=A0AA37SBE2_9GAMM|nr:TetR/AcrR family transcriptional regulator [Litoribrevibacter albus]GLQ31326.1 TetR family transcriptional regulator [Litoribrevibacter albus]
MVYRATANTQAKKAESRERLLNAGLDLVLEAGFTQLTINRVAQRAQVATGTVYRYFASKGELCEEIFLKATKIELAKVTETCKTPGKSPYQRMKTTLSEFAYRAIKGRRLAYALIAEPVDSMLDETRLQFRRAYAEQFSDLISEGIEAGDFREQSPMIAATAIVGAITEALVGPLSPNNCNPIESQKLTSDIVDFCMKAISQRA